MRAYWTEQWSEISPHVEPVTFHPEEDGRILVEVHQVVRDLAGAVLADEHVGHRFTLMQGLIRKMEVCPSLSRREGLAGIHQAIAPSPLGNAEERME